MKGDIDGYVFCFIVIVILCWVSYSTCCEKDKPSKKTFSVCDDEADKDEFESLVKDNDIKKASLLSLPVYPIKNGPKWLQEVFEPKFK